jgi:hypothetical protein
MQSEQKEEDGIMITSLMKKRDICKITGKFHNKLFIVFGNAFGHELEIHAFGKIRKFKLMSEEDDAAWDESVGLCLSESDYMWIDYTCANVYKCEELLYRYLMLMKSE